MQKSILYLVPTPVGNLEDISLRAIKVLRTVNYIFAEDTRTSGILLKHYSIKNNLKSYHKFNEKSRSEEIINLLLSGNNIAIISDAGTPGISDPSNIIVKEILSDKQYFEKIDIIALPGATAMIPALVASGFDTERFFMAGFLPQKNKDKDSLLSQLSELNCPVIFYEAPHRIFKFLTELKQFFRNADIVIAREISKKFETWHRGKLDYFLENQEVVNLKGEFVIIALPEKAQKLNETDLIIKIYNDKYNEISVSKACKIIAKETGISKNIVYDILLRIKES